MMRRALGLVFCVAVPLCAADPHMTSAERAKVLQWLDESRQEFLAAIEPVNDLQWRWKPAPEKWSVGEVAEHVVTAEASMFQKIQDALAAPANSAWEEKTRGKTEMIEMVMAPRLGRVSAPEPLVPKGDMTKAQVKARFEEERAAFVKFARETEAPLKEHTAEHPFPMFNPLNAYQWLIYAPLHTMRHDKQIAEVKASAGYPK